MLTKSMMIKPRRMKWMRRKRQMSDITDCLEAGWVEQNGPPLGDFEQRVAGRSMSLSVMVSNWPWILTGALTGFVAYCNRPLDWLSSPPQKATTEWLRGPDDLCVGRRRKPSPASRNTSRLRECLCMPFSMKSLALPSSPRISRAIFSWM
ncbi:hypothetical protein O3P69_001136 [Scylla paramamosain]|uniref:Uncharacterized protein n=1 Tax=Scylla paramamosain TaxID=85552 RepID=A0AAW0URH8_SCYPA